VRKPQDLSGLVCKFISAPHTRPLYPQGESSRYPLDRRLRGPHSRSGRYGEEKNPLPLPAIELYSSAFQTEAIPAELSTIFLFYMSFISQPVLVSLLAAMNDTFFWHSSIYFCFLFSIHWQEKKSIFTVYQFPAEHENARIRAKF
jgi:hypothetical protein